MKTVLALLFLFLGVLWALGQERPRRGRAMEKVELPEAESKIYVDGAYRYIEGNGVPNHAHGDFPNRGNPHAILPQQYKWRVPATPQIAETPTEMDRQPFGVGLNGIPFDPGTAEYWQNDPSSGWRYEALSGHLNLGIDDSNAHVQPNGAYHYHGLPVGLVLAQGKPDQMTLVGYAADGFPIYSIYGYAEADDSTSGFAKMTSSWKVKSGERPSGAKGPGGKFDGTFVADYEYVEGGGDLDASNGRFGPTLDYPEGIYHYYITEQFPFVPRIFKGEPDESFSRRGPGGRPPRRQDGPGGRRPPPRRR